ncbi:phenylacetate--CoA ligase family protein [Cellulophaga sp. E16_2]|uniref:phenylacetate--CoA ligase family protein n=1 Tax=Cellulophaga sp. E16_2 TaxID=2789297 RepID=UPI001A9361EF|nr:phenylacetate--CoA ligase family protein [Cellulophaga sp. E16_2]MBO0592803.1 phenylacetate--CoA ligase family protein [Cellulophaga sp. E16_2]
MLGSLRRKLFWSLDLVKGGKIAAHYKEIKALHEGATRKEQEPINARKITDLLEHAVATVPFYKKLATTSLSLESFPVVNKLALRTGGDEFKSGKYLTTKLHKVATSGSTGQPFIVAQDHNKRNRNTADTIYFGEKAGYHIGDRLFYFRLWDKQYRKNKWLAWSQNIAMYSVDEMDDAGNKKAVAELLHTNSSIGFLGYSSAFQNLCNYLEKTNSKPILNTCSSIICIAESLNDYVRDKLLYYFGVQAISRYSNSENGILGQQELHTSNKYYKINWASYHVEVLAFDSNIAVPLGELGRIVITDLYNFAMPMLRYDTGDVGMMERVEGELMFTKIDGRKMDMFMATNGELLSSHIVHKILQYDNIDQFQFVQETKTNYTIKIKLLHQNYFEDERKVIEEYQTYFGADAKVKIEYVDVIPALNSGKKKLVINMMLN